MGYFLPTRYREILQLMKIGYKKDRGACLGISLATLCSSLILVCRSAFTT